MAEQSLCDPSGFPSRVYRQIVTAEIVWTEDGQSRDWGSTIRDAIMSDSWPAWAGQINVTEVEELVPR